MLSREEVENKYEVEANSRSPRDEALRTPTDDVQDQEGTHFVYTRYFTKYVTNRSYYVVLTHSLIVQKVAVEERGVLHRDCSLNNAMIEDTEDGARGFLLDWEFAVEINEQNEYDMCGTVSRKQYSCNDTNVI